MIDSFFKCNQFQSLAISTHYYFFRVGFENTTWGIFVQSWGKRILNLYISHGCHIKRNLCSPWHRMTYQIKFQTMNNEIFNCNIPLSKKILRRIGFNYVCNVVYEMYVYVYIHMQYNNLFLYIPCLSQSSKSM